MIIQTKRIRQALLSIGIPSDKLEVRTPCYKGEYQPTKIHLHMVSSEAMTWVDKIAATGEVDITIFKGSNFCYPSLAEGTGKVRTIVCE